MTGGSSKRGRLGRLGFVVATSVAGVLAVAGCLSNNDAPPTIGVGPGPDAGLADAFVPGFDSAPPPATGNDASLDSPAPSDDAGEDAAPPVEAGPIDAGPPNGSQLGLVGGGTSSHSAHYTLVGSTGPATAPNLSSAHYGLVGGMAATTRK